MTDTQIPWPEELNVIDQGSILAIHFDNDEAYSLSAEYLRVTSPSAEVQGHSPDQKQTVPNKRNVKIIAVEPVGNYAIKLTFNDGHDTGIFTWKYLHELGSEQKTRWGEYLKELEAKGLERGG